MSLGVLNNLSAVYAENNLNNTNNSLSTVLQQLSSGSKINSGADDAAGLSLVDGLQANSTALSQSQTNATEGVGLLTVADGALSQVTNLLNRAVTLATEAANGTLNSNQDLAANQEYQSILSEVSNIGSTTTYNQESVFNSQTNIFTGDSSATGASIDALNISSLSSANLGDTNGVMSYSNGQSNVFINLSNAGVNAAVTDSLNSAGSTTINVSYLTKGADGAAVSGDANISVGTGTNYANTAQGLIGAINNSGLGLNATFTTAAQAGSAAVATATAADHGAGGATNTGIEISAAGIGANTSGANGTGVVGALSLASGDTLGGTLSIVAADGGSHNIALGTANSTDTLQNLEATINGAGYGVTASVNQAGNELTFTSADSNVSVTGTNLTQNTASSTATAIVQGSGLGSLTVGSTSDTLTGTMTVTSGVDGTTGHTITLGTPGSTDTLANLAASFSAGGANAGLGITATLNAASATPGAPTANTVLTFTKSTGDPDTAAITGSSITDVAAPTVTTSTTLGSLTLASAGDTLAASGSLDITSGITGKSVTPLALGTAGSTDTLANLATTINNAGYGITASLDTTGTVLTFTANAGNAATAVIAGAGTITDNTYPTKAATFAPGTTTLDTISVQGAGDTIQAAGNLVVAGTPLGGTAHTDTFSLATGESLSAIATYINTTKGDTGITATLNQAGTTLTFAPAAGTTADTVTLSAGTIVDNVAAVDTTAAVTAQNGTLGTLSVLSANNTLSGTLDVTEGVDKLETAGNRTVTGLTLANIAANFDNSEGSVKGNETADWSGSGITATLNSAGTQLTFTQASGDKGLAAISTSATAPLAETPVIGTGSTLGSLVVNQKADTLGGTLNITNGITGKATTLALGTAGQTDTLANLAATITNGGYGITAQANTAGTMLTFTQTSGSDTASISNTGSVSDTTAAANNTPISVASNVLTAANANDTLSGTLEVTPNGGSASPYTFTGQTLSQIASSFNSPDGANYASGITASLTGSALTFTVNGGAISGVGIADYTPASTANQSVATGTILNTLTSAGAGDLMSGSFQVHSGNSAGTALSTITLTAPQTLQQIADDFNGVTGGNATDKTALDVLGITATLNTAAIGTLGQAGYQAIGTVMTLTQTAGDPDQANVITGAGTLVDQVSAAAAGQVDGGIVAGTLHAPTLVVATAGDTLTGTLKITEGVDTNQTTSTLNLAGQTLAQIANDFNTTTGTVNLSNLGITAVLNNSTPASATSISFIANAGETGAANATVVASTAIVEQGTAVANTVTTASGTMLDTLSVNNKSDLLGGTLNLTNGLTGAASALTLGTTGSTDTLANLASKINSGGYGITASLNTAQTEMTLAQNSGDGFAAKASGTSVTDSMNASIGAGTGLGSLTVNGASDTLTGTLTGVEGDGKTAYTLNLSGQTLSQLAATINTTDAAYGITAALNQAGTQLSFSATSGDASTPTLGNEGNIADVTPAGQTAASLTDQPTTGASSTTLGSLTNMLSTETLSGSLKIGANTIDIGSANNTGASLAAAINKGDYGITAAYSNNTMTFTSANSSMAVDTSDLDETPINGSTATGVGSLTGTPNTSSSYYSVGVSGNVTDTSTTATVNNSMTYGGTGNVGIVTDANGSGGTATIGYSDAAGQSLSQSDLSNQTDAQAALTSLNKAITDVAAQDGYIGAQINTLNAVSSVLSTQAENVTSAQNAVQATDYAAATSNMSKYEILSQTGIAALAQANSMQQEVTKLLQ